MRWLVIGAGGMAGHMLVGYLQKHGAGELFYTARNKNLKGALQLDARDAAATEELIKSVSPDIIVNCTGLLNAEAERRAADAFEINGLLPHRLRRLADRTGARLIQISTDCVFSGARGNYAEHDPPDGQTVYARSKALGEIADPPHITVRTSIIGPEIRPCGIGLFKWITESRGTVKGYANVWWNGVTTLELARTVEDLAQRTVSGLVHLHAPRKTSKYELLRLICDVFGKRDVAIVPDGAVKLDRTLVSTRSDFPRRVPDYPEMLQQLRDWMSA